MIMLDNKNIKIIKLTKSLNHKNLGSYRIIKAYDNSAYELKLFAAIRRLHLVFHL